MKKNTAAVYVPLGLERSSSRAPPCVEEVEVLYLASSRTVVCFILRTSVLLFFFFFFFSCVLLFGLFFTLYLNVWEGIGLLYLVWY